MKYIKLLFLVITITSIFIIYKYNYNKSINYISLGDGLSLGIDSYGNEDYGYSDYIKDYLKEQGILNIYTKKYSSKEMSINELKRMIVMDEKVNYENKKINIKNILSESDVLTMSIGLNDLVYKMSINNTKSTTQINKIINDINENVLSLINEIKKYYNGEIYLIGYYENNKYDYRINYAINELNKKYQQIPNITYIATDYILNNNEKYLDNPNSYYPNKQGYQAISSKIIEKIAKKLEKHQNI